MPVTISCPGCGRRGELPDGTPPDATLTCQACGTQLPVWKAVAAAAPAPPGSGMAVWVGDAAAPPLATQPAPPAVTPANPAGHLERLRQEGERFEGYVRSQLAVLQNMREQATAFETKARADAAAREQALARDRALLDAREAEVTARLNERAEGLAAELERQVAAEREKLAGRAEALARGEEALARRQQELGASEGDARRELQAELDRLRGEVTELRAEVAELQASGQRDAAAVAELQGQLAAAAAQAASQRETIERMMAAGQKLIRQRDELRAKVQLAERTAAGGRSDAATDPPAAPTRTEVS